MGWKLWQIAVFLTVAFSAVYYGWGRDVSGLAIGVTSGLAALFSTLLLGAIIDLLRRCKALLFSRH